MMDRLMLELIPALMRWKAGNTLDRPPVQNIILLIHNMHHRIFSLSDQLKLKKVDLYSNRNTIKMLYSIFGTKTC